MVAPLAGSVDRNDALSVSGAKVAKSLPSRGAWIEIGEVTEAPVYVKTSLPSRGAWIKMEDYVPTAGAGMVAPLAGSGDRNINNRNKSGTDPVVAPLAGSVDRNRQKLYRCKWAAVAPLAGSVDRNCIPYHVGVSGKLVAPLAGSVDRNSSDSTPHLDPPTSLPSRGAWIEISCARQYRPA